MRLGLPPGDLLHTPSTCFGCCTSTYTGFSSSSRMQTTKRICTAFSQSSCPGQLHCAAFPQSSCPGQLHCAAFPQSSCPGQLSCVAFPQSSCPGQLSFTTKLRSFPTEQLSRTTKLRSFSTEQLSRRTMLRSFFTEQLFARQLTTIVVVKGVQYIHQTYIHMIPLSTMDGNIITVWYSHQHLNDPYIYARSGTN